MGRCERLRSLTGWVSLTAVVACTRPPAAVERPTAVAALLGATTASGETHGHADSADAGLAPIFLGEAPVVSHIAALPPLEQTLVVTFELVRQSKGAFDELRRRATALPADAGSESFAITGYPAAHDPPVLEQSRPSFVIDYDEPSVGKARAKAIELCGPSPTADQLARFVGTYIDRKDMLRGFDLASQVARRKEGDCTEHAVLLAALARSFGIPARVVMGMALVAIDGKVEAVGHAWTEVHQSGRWKLADAAIPPQVGARYLPMEVMDDEGPAFARRMVERPSPILLVRRIVLDAAPNPKP